MRRRLSNLDAVDAVWSGLAGSTEIPGTPHGWLSTLSPGFLRKTPRHAAALALLFTFHNFATADPVFLRLRPLTHPRNESINGLSGASPA
jgi:hypothetical protein